MKSREEMILPVWDKLSDALTDIEHAKERCYSSFDDLSEADVYAQRICDIRERILELIRDLI